MPIYFSRSVKETLWGIGKGMVKDSVGGQRKGCWALNFLMCLSWWNLEAWSVDLKNNDFFIFEEHIDVMG